jgi:hypothetical protein
MASRSARAGMGSAARRRELAQGGQPAGSASSAGPSRPRTAQGVRRREAEPASPARGAAPRARLRARPRPSTPRGGRRGARPCDCTSSKSPGRRVPRAPGESLRQVERAQERPERKQLLKPAAPLVEVGERALDPVSTGRRARRADQVGVGDPSPQGAGRGARGRPRPGEDDRDVVEPRARRRSTASATRPSRRTSSGRRSPRRARRSRRRRSRARRRAAQVSAGIRSVDGPDDRRRAFPRGRPIPHRPPPAAELRLGDDHRHRRAAAREGHEPEEVAPPLGPPARMRRRSATCAPPGSAGRLEGRRLVLEGARAHSRANRSTRQLPENLAQLGFGKSSARNSPRIRSSKSPSGRTRGRSRGSSRGPARDRPGRAAAIRASIRRAQDEHLEAPADAGRARRACAWPGPGSGTRRQGAAATPSSTQRCLSAWVWPRVGATTKDRSSGPAPASSQGRTTPAIRFRRSAKETGLRRERLQLGMARSHPKIAVTSRARTSPRATSRARRRSGERPRLHGLVHRRDIGDARRLRGRGVARLHRRVKPLVQGLQAGLDGLVAEGQAHGFAGGLDGGLGVGHGRCEVRSRAKDSNGPLRVKGIVLRGSETGKMGCRIACQRLETPKAR